MANYPKDPVLLLSVLNTHLRDFYPSLEELCKTNSLDMGKIIDKMKMIDYHYDEKTNQFK